MKPATAIQLILMLALLLLAPIALYGGFILPFILLPFSGLSDGARNIQLAGGGLTTALYVAVLVATLTGGFRRALKLLGIAFLFQCSASVSVLLTDPMFREKERAEAIKESFDAAARAHPLQVWCNGGFAYLRQDGDGIEYDVMLHRPASEGEFALWIGQYRVNEEQQSCAATLFAERYAVARRWFETCPQVQADFESLIDRIRHPTNCPYTIVDHWPKGAEAQ